MELTMVEVPGRQAGMINGTEVSGLGAQCPYCSKVHDEYDYEKGERLVIPLTCSRCGSPMDPANPEVKKFADARAKGEQHVYLKPRSSVAGITVAEALQVLKEAGYVPKDE